MQQKTLIVIMVAVLLWCCQAEYYTGYNTITTPGNTDTCNLRLSVGVSSLMNFYQGSSSNGCTANPFEFKSFFYGETTGVSLAFQVPNNQTTLGSSFSPDSVRLMNGSSCLYIPQNSIPSDLYLCSFTFGNLQLYMEVWTLNRSITLNPAYLNLFIPGYMNDVNTSQNNLVTSKGSVSSIVLRVVQSCSTTSSFIGNMTSQVFLSANFDLTFLLGLLVPQYAVVKPTGNTQVGNYFMVRFPVAVSVFSTPVSQNCYALPLFYNQFVPTLAYCNSGCSFTILMGDTSHNNFYQIQTTGFVSSQSGSNDSSGLSLTVLLLIIIIPACILLIIVIFVIWCCVRSRRNKEKAKSSIEDPVKPQSMPPMNPYIGVPNTYAPPANAFFPTGDPHALAYVGSGGIHVPNNQPVISINTNEIHPYLGGPLENGVLPIPTAAGSPPVPVYPTTNGVDAGMKQTQQRAFFDDSFAGQYLCIICAKRKADAAIHPCYHVVSCRECLDVRKNCPQCGVTIESKLNVYYPTISDYQSRLSTKAFESTRSKLVEEHELLCFVCTSNKINTMFIPCGHLYSCDDCAGNVARCPFCKLNIFDIKRVEFSAPDTS